jgi:hypothetical protein
MPDAVMPSPVAAAVKLPPSATATNALIVLKSICKLTGNSVTNEVIVNRFKPCISAIKLSAEPLVNFLGLQELGIQ